jgi:putative addiction module component (TIGR02574 family)
MSRAAKQLLTEALALPESERLDMAAELLVSVDGPPDPGWEDAWLAELDRREADSSPAEPWDAVRAELRSRLRPR